MANLLRLLCVVCVLVALCVSVEAGAEDAKNVRSQVSKTIRSFLDLLGLKSESREKVKVHDALKRQTPGMECISNQNCTPPGYQNVPTSLIECDENFCVCNDCFTRNGTIGRCVIDDNCVDYYYDSNLRECVDNRRSQLTAFLLSLFLCSTGAANFYIGQTGLAVAQLLILLLLIFFPCVFCCISCCMMCCVSGGEKRTMAGVKEMSCGLLFFCVTFLAVLVAILCSLSLSAWWIADLVIFATNKRDAGNGCPLVPDL